MLKLRFSSELKTVIMSTSPLKTTATLLMTLFTFIAFIFTTMIGSKLMLFGSSLLFYIHTKEFMPLNTTFKNLLADTSAETATITVVSLGICLFSSPLTKTLLEQFTPYLDSW